MQLTALEITSLILTYLAFGAVGFPFAKRFKRPVAPATWLTVVLLTIGSGFFAETAVLVGIGGFKIYMNTSLQAIGVGVILGLATRELRLRLKDTQAE